MKMNNRNKKKIGKKIKIAAAFNYKDLEHKHKLFIDLMKHSPDVIYFKDKKAKIVMVNDAHARGLGLRPEQVVGKTDFDFFPKARAEVMLKDDMQVIRTGKPIIDKVERATRPDGVDNYVSTTKIPRFDEHGKIIGLVGITRDITRRMQLEHLKDDKARLEKKIGALEEMNKMKSEFISVVSHELRTPLAIMQEAVSIIFDGAAGPVNDQQKDFLGKTLNNAQRLNNLIEELLDMSRIESGRLKLHFSLVNINDLLMDSAPFFKKTAQDKGITLEYKLPLQEVNMFLDAERSGQIISNLINNAIKFTEPGGRITIELIVLEDKIRVAVIDTGMGIARQDLVKIFDKFVQVSNAEGAERKGVGLGLAIARELAEKHGGEIWAESKLGVGSKFYFTLPRFYLPSALDEKIRESVNSLLKENAILHLINLTIINYNTFQKKVAIDHSVLAQEFKKLIYDTIDEFMSLKAGEAGVEFCSIENGEACVVLSKIGDAQTYELWELFKSNIKEYFVQKKGVSVFVNLGVLSYPPQADKKKDTYGIKVKRIFIGSEQRRFKRYNYNADIEIGISDGSTEAAKTVDISQGGFCFVCANKLETDSLVHAKLKLPGKNKFVIVEGKVAWIKDISDFSKCDSRKYRVGMEFTNIKEAEKNKLLQFIKKLPQED
ncbi:MAG: ATP-binding protein [Candidatus Omnitrophota bacterium]